MYSRLYGRGNTLSLGALHRNGCSARARDHGLEDRARSESAFGADLTCSATRPRFPNMCDLVGESDRPSMPVLALGAVGGVELNPSDIAPWDQV